MSHTFKAKNGTVFNYDQGVEGVVALRAIDIPMWVRIPADDLLEFVAICAIMPRQISELEDMHWQQVLGVPLNQDPTCEGSVSDAE